MSDRILRHFGWEPDEWERGRGYVTYLRPHPNDIARYTKPRAMWIALTGRSRRGGWNAKGWSSRAR